MPSAQLRKAGHQVGQRMKSKQQRRTGRAGKASPTLRAAQIGGWFQAWRRGVDGPHVGHGHVTGVWVRRLERGGRGGL